MTHYKYLIIGGGMTADAAVGGIRQLDGEGSIGLIGEEPSPSYDRPPLSKGLWRGDSIKDIWRNTQEQGVEVHLGLRAQVLESRNRRLTDERGEVYTFEKLLLATGGRPRRLPFGEDRIVYFRTLEDYRKLRTLAEQGRRFAVIGGGFIGSEIAAALAMNGKEVVMLFPTEAIGSHAFPAYLARFYSSVELGPNGYVRMIGHDGIIRAMGGANANALGLDLSAADLFKKLPAKNTGWYYTKSGFSDQVQRLVTFRALPEYPLVITIGLAVENIFARFHLKRVLYFSFAIFPVYHSQQLLWQGLQQMVVLHLQVLQLKLGLYLIIFQ